MTVSSAESLFSDPPNDPHQHPFPLEIQSRDVRPSVLLEAAPLSVYHPHPPTALNVPRSRRESRGGESIRQLSVSSSALGRLSNRFLIVCFPHRLPFPSCLSRGRVSSQHLEPPELIRQRQLLQELKISSPGMQYLCRSDAFAKTLSLPAVHNGPGLFCR